MVAPQVKCTVQNVFSLFRMCSLALGRGGRGRDAEKRRERVEERRKGENRRGGKTRKRGGRLGTEGEESGAKEELHPRRP
jgi:hypothetical protein